MPPTPAHPVKLVSLERSKGDNAVAVAAFNSAERIHHVSSGRTFDHRISEFEFRTLQYRANMPKVVRAQVALPDDAPAHMRNLRHRHVLWNMVQDGSVDKGKDDVLAYEVQAKMPNELGPRAAGRLLDRVAAEAAQRLKRPVDAFLALPEKGSDHYKVHFLMPARQIENDGFGAVSPIDLKEFEQHWTDRTNGMLAETGKYDAHARRAERVEGYGAKPNPLQRMREAAGDYVRNLVVRFRNAESEGIRKSDVSESQYKWPALVGERVQTVPRIKYEEMQSEAAAQIAPDMNQVRNTALANWKVLKPVKDQASDAGPATSRQRTSGGRRNVERDR